MQIHLVRHGRSAFAFPERWITLGEFRDWIEEYNRTGIAEDSLPPAEVVALLHDDPVLVCSDYPRSVESAARLAPRSTLRISAVYREVGRPLPWDVRLRLPLAHWDRISVLCWKGNLSAADESVWAARVRAEEAAGELTGLAQRFSRALLVGHGMVNAMIGNALRRKGWIGPWRANDRFWGVDSFCRDA
jgi:broad specificity phosphatase PhoE